MRDSTKDGQPSVRHIYYVYISVYIYTHTPVYVYIYTDMHIYKQVDLCICISTRLNADRDSGSVAEVVTTSKAIGRGCRGLRRHDRR